MIVIKRDGRREEFNKERISSAVQRSFKSVDGEVTDKAKLKSHEIANSIADQAADGITVEEIQDLVEKKLMNSQRKDVARAFITYRNERTRLRGNTIDKEIKDLVEDNSDYWKGENSNKNPMLNTTKRDYMAGIVSKDATERYLLPPEIVQAHKEGLIHFHDQDYFLQHSHNCDLVNLGDMLQNGTMISDTLIEKPHSFSTACNVATQIIAQVASSQYGGQSISAAQLSPFVDVSRQRIRNKLMEELAVASLECNENQIQAMIELRLRDEIKKGVQIIQYQVLTLMTTNGQAPFITVFLYLDEVPEGSERDDLAMVIEEILRQRIEGVKNEEGVWITPAFPKLIYVLDEDNITKDSKYWYLTELAAKCTAKRMVPDYISAKVMKELKGDVYTCMGCRSFLTPDRCSDAVGNIANAKNYKEGIHKYYGRFNQGVVTINLPDIALSALKEASDKDEVDDIFWRIFDERTELCHRALRLRHERLLGTSAEVSPILWRYGALARLEPGEKIDKLLYNGYSTISLGYAGLYECVKAITGCSHSDEGVGEAFGLKVMQALNDKCNQWKQEENIDYSLYGTPLEATTEKFAKKLQERFGVIEGITDRNYVTNSYHIPVFEAIDPFEKLRIEAKFQKLSPGGAISYIETSDLTGNPEAVLEVMKYIYNNIMYAELNTKSDYCEVCGYDKEIKLIDDGGKLIWECPNCGNRDATKMNVARRTCGYLGTAKNGWNQGRLGDIHDRYVHLSDHEYEVI